MVINTGIIICYGHIKNQITISGHTGYTFSQVTLPITFSVNYSATITVRNNGQFASGAIEPTLNTINFVITNHSDNSQSIYGVYYHCIGY